MMTKAIRFISMITDMKLNMMKKETSSSTIKLEIELRQNTILRSRKKEINSKVSYSTRKTKNSSSTGTNPPRPWITRPNYKS